MPLRLVEFKNLQKQPVPSDRKSYYDDITEWETQGRNNRNDFPQQLIQDVNDSPTGSSAIDIWEEFVSGQGFISPELNEIIVNREGETLEELTQKAASDLVRFYGFAIHVSYNAKGLPSEFHHQPFEQTRLGKISKTGKVADIKTNPYFGIPQDYEKKYTKKYYTYNSDPAHVIQEIREHNINQEYKFEYPGQIFWVSIERPLARVYPVPFYYSGINWFRIDSEIQRFHERNLKNNMLLSHIINVVGDPDAPVGDLDEDGNANSTVGREFDKQLERHAQGAEVGGGQWVNWGASKEDFAEVTAFPTQSLDNIFTALQEQTNSQISIATNTPPILLNIQTAGKLGETKEIINAIKMMQGKVKRLQQFLSKNIKKLVIDKDPSAASLDFGIRDINVVNVLPEWAMEKLTGNESRSYLADNFNVKLEVVDEGEAAGSRFQEFGVGGVQGILAIQQGVGAGTISQEGAIETLKVVYGFTNDTAMKMLGVSTITDPATGQSIQAPEQQEDIANDALRNLTGRQLQSIQRTVRKFNRDELTYDQAKTLLREFFKSDADIDAWLVTTEEAQDGN